jgi:hypothetical protein
MESSRLGSYPFLTVFFWNFLFHFYVARCERYTDVLIVVGVESLHTYHSRFIPEGVAEASQILRRDAHVLPKLAMRNTADVTAPYDPKLPQVLMLLIL